MKTQININDVVGEYALKGVHEMAAGFKFNQDFSFQFFYIYGASDRKADGKFEIEDNKIILHGSKKAGNDFNIVNKSTLEKGYTVQINCENRLFIKNVVCFFYESNRPLTVETDSNGTACAEMSQCSKIELIHSYFPDLPTVIDLTNEKCNFFELTLNPSLEDVVFDNYVFEFEDDAFKCSNIYLFGPNAVQFEKQH